MGPGEQALVIGAGNTHVPEAIAERADLVIAADGGLHTAQRQGLKVHIVVGDFDSVSSSALERARRSGAEIQRHRTDKDYNDLELALQVARDRVRRVHVVVDAGGRLDHALANVALLGSPTLAAIEVDATIGETPAWVIRPGMPRQLPLGVGEHLGLLALGGPARRVFTRGVRYRLHREDLWPFEARGTANEVTEDYPKVRLGEGVLLALSAPTPTNDHRGSVA